MPVGPVRQPHRAAGAPAALVGMVPSPIGEGPAQIVSLHNRVNPPLDGHAYTRIEHAIYLDGTDSLKKGSRSAGVARQYSGTFSRSAKEG